MTEPLSSTLRSRDPRALAGARLQLHHAAQLASAPGRFLAPARADDSHTALHWDSRAARFTGAAVDGWRCALRAPDLTLQWLDASGAATAEFNLDGKSYSAGLAWLQTRAAGRGAAAGQLAGAIPYEVPDHPVAQGAFFSAVPADLAALAAWFTLADSALSRWMDAHPGAAPALVWPHHFDLGSLLPLDPGGGETARSVGIGLSPGDGSYDEPYFYVTAWPAPAGELPGLASGHWHSQGWTGMVLTAGELLQQPGDAAARADEFLAAATAIALRLLGG